MSLKTTVLCLPGLLLALSGCGGSGARPTAADSHPGRAVYVDKGCGGCHGAKRQGQRTAPPLYGLAAHWDAETLIAYLEDPNGVKAQSTRLQLVNEQYPVEMPPIKGTPEEFDRLAGYLLEF